MSLAELAFDGASDEQVLEECDPELFQEGVAEHARYLGMDPLEDQAYLWIAKESLVAPLPKNWKIEYTSSGAPFYFSESGESCWEHPLDKVYKQKFIKIKKLHQVSHGYKSLPESSKNWISNESTEEYSEKGSMLPGGILQMVDEDIMLQSVEPNATVSENPLKCKIAFENELKQSSTRDEKESLSKKKEWSLVQKENEILRSSIAHLELQLDAGAEKKTKEICVLKAEIDRLSKYSVALEEEKKDLENNLIDATKVKNTSEVPVSTVGNLSSKEVVMKEAEVAYPPIKINDIVNSLQFKLNNSESRIEELQSENARNEKLLWEARQQNLLLEGERLGFVNSIREMEELKLEASRATEYQKDIEIELKHAEEKYDILELKLYEASKRYAEKMSVTEKSAHEAKLEAKSLKKEVEVLIKHRDVHKKEMNSVLEKVAANEMLLKETVENARNDAKQEAKEEAALVVNSMRLEVKRYQEMHKAEMSARRELHNRLTELQGNIRVFCRVRPIQEVEKNGQQAAQAVFFEEGDNQKVDLVVGEDSNRGGQRHKFEFDYVFQPNSTQEEVFRETSALVTSAMDGYSACIFAYGQTGSGKTFTMEGAPDDPGVNLRSMSELFRIRNERESTGQVKYSMKLSMLEVYNENIIDLLKESPGPGGSTRQSLDIRVGKRGIFVENLIDVEVYNENDVKELMFLGNSHRSIGAHDANERSSRSHLVLCLQIECICSTDGKSTYSKLNLIDLAGSERIAKTAASGQRLKEAQNINRSLSALGDVISALGISSSKHVPYRNSKLTFLLQDCLSGNSKVLMFVNISPITWNAWESICSLKFAARCRRVALGKAEVSNSR